MTDGEKREPRGGNCAEAQGVRRHRVLDFFGDQREVILEHDGHDYRLQITSNGKLILTN